MQAWTLWIAALSLAAVGDCRAADLRLDGRWTTGTLTPFERPDEFKVLIPTEAEATAFEAKYRGKPPPIPDDAIGAVDSEWWETDVGLARIRGRPRSSWIVSPADGQTPYTHAAKAANKARRERSKTNFDNPEGRPDGERCLSTGGSPLEAGAYTNGFQILETRDAVVILTEWMTEVRVIRLPPARHAPSTVRDRMGDSIGWWEGATLVVDTTNFAPSIVKAPDGDAAADLRVIERFTRLSAGELHYTFLVANPARYVQPLQGEMVFRSTDQPMFEFACHEGNYGLRNVLAGGRAEDAAKATAAAAP
jgi:hypothetical protein